MQDAPHCLNCGTVAPLNFCPSCGQDTHAHVPSAREFMHEFITHYVAIEGKLWRTVKLMILKPGLLTTEYLAGRRARYVNPLRIFLTFSIIFFATLKFGGAAIVEIDPGDEVAFAEQEAKAPAAKVDAPTAKGPATAEGPAAVLVPAKPAAATASAPAPAAEVPAAKVATGDKAPAAAEDERIERRDPSLEVELGDRDVKALNDVVSPAVAEKAKAFMKLPTDQRYRLLQAAFFSYAPYAMLLLMPVFALYLKLLYLGTGRLYGEHFLFALHTNAFAYLQITLIMLMPWGFLRFLLVMWLVFYLPTAMRRVYGGSRTLTALRWMVLAFLHTLSLAVAVGAVLLLPLMS